MKMRKITRYKCILISAFLGVGSVMIHLVNTLSNQRTTCVFDGLGGKCLGCNIRAALYQLSKGHMLEAFHLNPLVYVWVLFAGCLVVSEIYTAIRRFKTKKCGKDSLFEWLIKKMFKGVAF